MSWPWHEAVDDRSSTVADLERLISARPVTGSLERRIRNGRPTTRQAARHSVFDSLLSATASSPVGAKNARGWPSRPTCLGADG